MKCKRVYRQRVKRERPSFTHKVVLCLEDLKKCERLISAGLIESVKNQRNRVFMITEKGLKFFQEFKRFQKFARLDESKILTKIFEAKYLVYLVVPSKKVTKLV